MREGEHTPLLHHGEKQTLPKTASSSAKQAGSRPFSSFFSWFKRDAVGPYGRVVRLGADSQLVDAGGNYVRDASFPPNLVRNTRYTLVSFLPLCLFNQFRLFFNLYFLLITLSQFIPVLKVGYLFTYLSPLLFVLALSLSKEAYDDIQRSRRDKTANSEEYTVLDGNAVGCLRKLPASAIRVGDILRLSRGERVPADCVLLRTSDAEGSAFIKTTQLDGETDFKLRTAAPSTQSLGLAPEALLEVRATLDIPPPTRKLYDFAGRMTVDSSSLRRPAALASAVTTAAVSPSVLSVVLPPASAPGRSLNIVEPLSLENTVWANTAIATGYVDVVVVGTGPETRSALNISRPEAKIGTFEREVNVLCVVLFVLQFALALVETLCGDNSGGYFFLELFRFVLLFSAIIPVSCKVNLDIGKLAYAYFVQSDRHISGAMVRNSGIPEQLGRLSFLLSDKTGTLTQNIMTWSRFHVAAGSFYRDMQRDVEAAVAAVYTPPDGAFPPSEQTLQCQIARAVFAMASCHNVTPAAATDVDGDADADTEADEQDRTALSSQVDRMDRRLLTDASERSSRLSEAFIADSITPVQLVKQPDASVSPSVSVSGTQAPAGARAGVVYQASSPDEVALVEYAARVGLVLTRRTPREMQLTASDGTVLHYAILQSFPFSSVTKRMGIILQPTDASGAPTAPPEVIVKGADSVIAAMLDPNCPTEWLPEEVGNLSREGLRTLVFARRPLTQHMYDDFARKLHAARASLTNRSELVLGVENSLMRDLVLIGVSGVEDKLQDGVRTCLEQFSHAGIRCWVLTGDKPETAMQIATAIRLGGRRYQSFFVLQATEPGRARQLVSRFASSPDKTLVVDGATLDVLLDSLQGAGEEAKPGDVIIDNPSRLPAWLCRLFRFCGAAPLTPLGGLPEHGMGSLGGGLAEHFIAAAVRAPAVVCCRCSPTQKAVVARLVGRYTGKHTAAVGDGANDVSLLQAAEVGIGIVGKEGMQAALAADYSVNKFEHLRHLVLFHGRNAYQRSSAVSQFIIYRGVSICVIQAIFSALWYFSSLPLFTGWLSVGYSTAFLMLPAVALIFDESASRDKAVGLYPELYRDLSKGRSLSFKSFFVWLAQGVWSGSAIMLGCVLLFDASFYATVAVSFTCLIVTELVTLLFTITRWYAIMVASEALSLLVYAASLLFLRKYFDLSFILSTEFAWKVAAITAVATVPIGALRKASHKLNPPKFSKV
jgi:phospholipid-translocating ATPase